MMYSVVMLIQQINRTKSTTEIHTGDEWIPARDHFCSRPDVNHNDMLVELVIFSDKSHADLHGALALTPIIFTLTLFNRTSRNNPKFWRPLADIPNLGYGKNKADKTATKDKVQNEHECLSVAFQSIIQIGYIRRSLGCCTKALLSNYE